MKIDDSKKPRLGKPLSSFGIGVCIRLVHDGGDEQFLGHVYIAGASMGGRIATCLSNGMHRSEGLFVLEPNAKVVIE